MRINGLNFPPENRSSVIRRMQAERNRIATQYRAEGEEAAMKIEATTELETRKLLAEAARQAEVARGRGEAEALRIYGEAYAEDPELFTFLRTLEAYEKLVDEDTTLVLRSDSELWRLLEKGTR